MILLLAFNSDLSSQTTTLSKKEQRQNVRQEKEKASAEEAAKKFELMKAMVSSGRFVIEADRFTNRWGNEYSVQSELNYILVDSINSAIQTGLRSSSAENGIGGSSVNGEVRNYTVKLIAKRNSFNIKYDLYERVGSNSITILVSSSGYASAIVRDNFGSSTRFYGRLVPLHECYIYKGPREL